MKRSRVAAILVVLLFAFACFLSMPVMAELPWDADSNDDGGGGGTTGGGQTPDTTVVDDNVDTDMESSHGDDPYWLPDLLSRFTVSTVLFHLLGLDNTASANAETGSTSGIG